MFARTLELTVKAEKKPELIKKAKVEILPVLHKQLGFVQVFALENEVKLNKAFIVTLWYTKMDAERYEREIFPKNQTDLYRCCLIFNPSARTTRQTMFAGFTFCRQKRWLVSKRRLMVERYS